MAKKKIESKNAFRSFLIFIAVFLVAAFILSFYNSPFEKPEEISINRLAELILQEQVEEIIVVEGTDLTVTLNDEAKTEYKLSKESSESLPTLLTAYGVSPEQLQGTNIKVEGMSGWKYFLVNIAPILLPIGFVILFLWIIMRQVQGSNNKAMMFGQSQAKADDPEQKKKRTTFQDVAGLKEPKEELMEVVEFLKHPKKFTALGAKIPKGVLLMGPPGTGKTLMARAVAGEANVPFFHVTGSEFVEMFVGVGASRVRDMFKKAKKAAPSILFIDEIDAVGRQRGSGLGGSHDEREQTLNQILTEMDGFEPDTGVIVIAATNRPDVLDPALLRPGRFDRRVVLDLPDLVERLEILQVHGRNKVFGEDVKLKIIAQRTTGFSGADLENLLNEAAIFAARRNKKKISMDECLESIDKVLLGPERKSARFSDKEKKITAYHEAGHALTAHFMPESDPVRKISIIPRGRAGGYTLKLPEEDKKLHSRKEMMAEIVVALGGHAAERFKFGDITTGASSDLQKSTQLAHSIVAQYGMSDKLGPRTYGVAQEMIFLGKEIHEQRDYSDKTAEAIDIEMSRIIDEQYTAASELLESHEKELDLVAERLLEVETLEQEEFEKLLGGKK
ncbi:MAG: ATP-dependent zinc metalloprotease FtsH [Candidatus Kerfeldbacteria bacterium]